MILDKIGAPLAVVYVLYGLERQHSEITGLSYGLRHYGEHHPYRTTKTTEEP
jgi:hypothetical protein